MFSDLILMLSDRNAKLPDWASDALARNKFARDQKELPRYAQIESQFKDQAVKLVNLFQEGKLPKKELITRFKANLFEAETAAFAAGKRSAGSKVYFVTPGEQKMLVGRHSRNMRYFNRFVRDMETGRGKMAYSRRAELYASSLWSIYNRGQSSVNWDASLPENTRWEWVMDPDSEHCEDCIERWETSRRQGGYTWDELIQIGFPGEGTRCMTKCRCHVRPIHKRVLQEPRIGVAAEQEGAIEGVRLLQDILGGETMPLAIPAAGLPPVKFSPATVAKSINEAGIGAGDLAKKVPVAIQVIAKPEQVYEASGTRTYVGQGMMVQVRRGDGGAWELSKISNLGPDGLPVGESYIVPWVRDRS